jgi:hypothetical protein
VLGPVESLERAAWQVVYFFRFQWVSQVERAGDFSD